jgi:hypothetical protein
VSPFSSRDHVGDLIADCGGRIQCASDIGLGKTSRPHHETVSGRGQNVEGSQVNSPEAAWFSSHVRCLVFYPTLMADRAHSTRQYKQRFIAWQVRKNLNSEDIEALLRRCTKEELQNALGNGRDSSLMLQGRILSRALVLRQLRRLRLTENSADELAKSLTWSGPYHAIPASPRTPPKHTTQPKRAHICTSSGCPLAEIGFTSINELEQHQKVVHGLETGSESCDEFTALEANSTLRADIQISTPSVSTSFPRHQSVQDFVALGYSTVNASRMRDEQDTTEKDTNECDEEESDARRKRRKIRFRSPLETKALACPFYQYDPRRYNPQNENIDLAMRYRTCAGPGWESISRLRYHHLVWFAVALADHLGNIYFALTFLQPFSVEHVTLCFSRNWTVKNTLETGMLMCQRT